jgi:hypothetical protein
MAVFAFVVIGKTLRIVAWERLDQPGSDVESIEL